MVQPLSAIQILTVFRSVKVPNRSMQKPKRVCGKIKTVDHLSMAAYNKI